MSLELVGGSAFGTSAHRGLEEMDSESDSSFGVPLELVAPAVASGGGGAAPIGCGFRDWAGGLVAVACGACGWFMVGWAVDELPTRCVRGGADPMGRGGAPIGWFALLVGCRRGGMTLGILERDLDLLPCCRRGRGGRSSGNVLGVRLTGLGSCIGSGGRICSGRECMSV